MFTYRAALFPYESMREHRPFPCQKKMTGTALLVGILEFKPGTSCSQTRSGFYFSVQLVFNSFCQEQASASIEVYLIEQIVILLSSED